MRYPRNWLIVVLPFVYIAVILGLATIQYAKKTSSFQQSIGDLSVTGTMASGSRAAELKVRAWGAAFVFDAQHTATADLSDGKTSVALVPQSWKWKSGNLEVTFSRGLVLNFLQTGASAKSLQVLPVAANGQFSAIHLPLSTDARTQLTPLIGGNWAVLAVGKAKVLLSVDGGRDLLRPDHTLLLSAEKDGFRPARLDPLVEGVSPALLWLTLDAPTDPQKAEKGLADYWDRAYARWRSAPVFSTALVDALGREANRRGDYADVGPFLMGLRSGRQWGFDASAFLGNIVDLTVQKRSEVETASSRSQLDWAHANRLWMDARYYGPPGSSDRVRDQMLRGDLPSDTASLLGVFQNLQDLQRFQPNDIVMSRLDEVANRLLTVVVRRDAMDYVVTKEGYFDLRSSLELGRLYLTYAHRQAQDLFATLGARLILSALGWADTSGVVPEVLVVQDGTVSQTEGKILPETIYSLVYPEPPQETELAEWGPGSFIRTPAQIVERTLTASTASFSLRFPTGAAEHLILTGVQPFDHITMHGIRWRSDPDFQSYTDGWLYSLSTKTLWVKIKHRQDLEQFVIHFSSSGDQ